MNVARAGFYSTEKFDKMLLMYGTWILLILILISSLPVIAVYIWFRAAKYPFSLIQFLLALLAGAATLFPALVLQDLLDFTFLAGGRLVLFYQFFIRIALTEELSRLLVLLIFFWINRRVTKDRSINVQDKSLTDHAPSFLTIKKATATGLVAGFGFALLETARYAASSMDISVLLLRLFTAAVHGACGARIGAAAVLLRANPMQALLRILTATAIHGIYNLMVTLPGISSIAAILIAVSALSATVMTIRGRWSENENYETP